MIFLHELRLWYKEITSSWPESRVIRSRVIRSKFGYFMKEKYWDRQKNSSCPEIRVKGVSTVYSVNLENGQLKSVYRKPLKMAHWQTSLPYHWRDNTLISVKSYPWGWGRVIMKNLEILPLLMLLGHLCFTKQSCFTLQHCISNCTVHLQKKNEKKWVQGQSRLDNHALYSTSNRGPRAKSH